MKAYLRMSMAGLAAVLVVHGVSAQPAPDAPVDPARIAQGKALFDATGCSGCHGYAGQGGIGPMAGPRIAELPADGIIAIIRQPPQPMPVFSAKVLPDEKVRLIADYLHSLPPPPDAAVTDRHFPIDVTGGHGKPAQR